MKKGLHRVKKRLVSGKYVNSVSNGQNQREEGKFQETILLPAFLVVKIEVVRMSEITVDKKKHAFLKKAKCFFFFHNTHTHTQRT